MIGTVEERRRELESVFSPWEEMTIWARFEKNAKKYSDQIYVICDDDIYTYAKIKKEADMVALGLHELGVKAEDHVAVYMRNRVEYVILTYAIAKLGAVKVPLNTGMKREELCYSLKEADVKWMITDKRLDSETLSEAQIKRIITLNDCEGEKIVTWERLYQYASFSEEKEEVEAFALQNREKGDAVCDILFTSGSSSKAKGIMIHHDMLLRSAYGTCYTRCMEQGRRIYVPIPFFHLFAYIEGMISAMLVGGTIILSKEKYNAHRVLNSMRKHKANDIICVSYIMINMLEKGKPNPQDYPDMHACYFASACPKDTWQRAREAFGITDVSTGYGMTECGSTTTMISPEDPLEKVELCHGKLKRAGSGMETLLHLRIVDSETGKEVPTGCLGEICCKGSTVMKGYYKNPIANQESFDQDGWFHTRDLGRIDSEGYLEYVGRDDDVYKINGENVSPFYLDSIIGQCECVKVVETVGITHPKCGAIGVAFVDSDEEPEIAKKVILEYCQTHLAGFQIPKHIIFGHREDWPTTDTGKIKKKELQRMAEEYLQNKELAKGGK